MKFFRTCLFLFLLQMILYAQGETLNTTRTIPANSVNDGNFAVCSDFPVSSVSFKWITSSANDKLFSSVRNLENLDGEEVTNLSCGFPLNPISSCELASNNVNGHVICMLFGNPNQQSVEVTIDITFTQ
ncbi:hypothetical protein RCL_jg16226.t1 [Rhizophagus clarus]|uniref:Ig-like domain-containing protein n=1 Tax=Rhizophagus clarus TaxID=94130 RepID=A0A8H3R856_9GLOM|nr:hypothetical protein RCL_jg16226.t1 [Rhizophagus clarus]